MRVGVPKEIKNHEYRVGLTPESVRQLVAAGHQVLVQSQAGAGAAMSDIQYQQAGATIVADTADIYDAAQMIIKVKEPQPSETALLRKEQILYAFLHLAPDRQQSAALLNSGAVCIAYETITDAAGGLPLLTPMSEVAGRLSIQAAAHYLERPHGGKGVLLAGVPGTAAGRVVVLGAGVVGAHAARLAVGAGAQVTVLDRNLNRLRALDAMFGNRIHTLYSSSASIEQALLDADAVIGAVLIPGALAPKLVSRELISAMQPGSVVVDVAIDQGGCFATSRPTTHAEPTFAVGGVTHYCVANMPGAVPRTSTFALNNAILPHALAIAELGWREALRRDADLRNGLNICAGQVTHPAVAHSLGYPYVPADQALALAP